VIASHDPNVLTDHLEHVVITDFDVFSDASLPAPYFGAIFAIWNLNCAQAMKLALVIVLMFAPYVSGLETLYSAFPQRLPKRAHGNHGEVRCESATADQRPGEQTENLSNPH
jgi:hypothetical protein